MADEKSDNFLKDKVVADFGCGPRGSLFWTKAPRVKIGIDVLSDVYVEKFSHAILQHDMIYVKSTENFIPIPSQYVDVLYTINSLDHVDNLQQMLNELERILKPNGILYGSFNLNETASACEPQSLDVDKIKKFFCKNFKFTYKLAVKDSTETYKNMMDSKYLTENDTTRAVIMWVKAQKN